MLLVTNNGKSHMVTNLDKGLHLLHTWGILPDSPTPLPPRNDHNTPRRNLNQAMPKKS